jgi:hypothetical protein
MELIGNLAALAVIFGVAVGVPMLITALLRERRRAREYAAQMQAWREAQSRFQDAQAGTYEASVALQKDACERTQEYHATYIRFNERAIAVQEAQLRLLESQLDETRRTNALLAALVSQRAEARRDAVAEGPTEDAQ